MKYTIIDHIADTPSYDVVKIKLIGENEIQQKLILSFDKKIEEHMALAFGVIEIIEENTPEFIVKKVKDKIGFGK